MIQRGCGLQNADCECSRVCAEGLPCAFAICACALPLAACQPRLQRVQVARHQRRDVGVEDGGRGALELAEFRQDLGGEGDAQAACLGQAPDGLLVGRVGEGEEQADRQRLGPGGDDPVEHGGDLGLVQRRQDLAVRRHPLRHLEAQLVGHGQPARREGQSR